MDYFFIILIVVAIVILFFTKSGKDFIIATVEKAKLMKKERNKHARNFLIITVAGTILMALLLGIDNIGWAILWGVIVAFLWYILCVLGLNPWVNAVKNIGSVDDYGIKASPSKDHEINK